MGQDQTTYSRVKEYKDGNALVRVHFPDLTPEEREFRMKLLKDATRDIVIEAMRVNSKKESNVEKANA